MNCQQNLMLFAGDTPASLSPLPGTEEARKMTVISGRKCSALLKNANLSGSLAKMLLDTSLWGSTECYLTWRAKATPRNRLLFQLLPSMRRTGETAFGLLPTMTATNANGRTYQYSRREKTKPVLSLAGVAKLWPTPTASQEAKNATLPVSQINRDNLAGALLRAGEKRGGQLNPEWVEWLMGYPEGWTDLDHSETQ